ncbi:MAG TPA: hypothetical protein PK093_12280 [Phycisphaerae bacterium]|nr:hypothetical protein [Phycisphaerae bacterium]
MDSKDRRLMIIAAVVAGGLFCGALTCAVVVPRMLKSWTQSAVSQMQGPIPVGPIVVPNEPVVTIPAPKASIASALWRRWIAWKRAPAAGPEIVKTGELVLPTGRVLVTDINFVDENAPLRRTVDPGTYPVYEFSDRMSSAAMIVFRSDGAPSQWVIADSFGDGGSPISGLAPRGSFGIDSGVIVVDAGAFSAQSNYDAWPMIREETKSVVQDPKTGANVILLTALSNVEVDAQWGLDAEGRPVALVLYNPDLHQAAQRGGNASRSTGAPEDEAAEEEAP